MVKKKQMKYLTKKDIKLPKRSPESHKGQNGTVLVIGGSMDYVGAVLLAGMAAFRTGVDKVVIAAPEKVAWAINTFSPDFITKKFSGNYLSEKHAKELIRMSKDFDVVLMGNGMGKKPATFHLIRKLAKIKKFKVIDADAIKALKLQDVENAVFTPHAGELEILLKNSGKENIAKIQNLEQKSRALQKIVNSNIILLKGRIDAIISKEKIAYNKTGNPGMTVAGTGDVLAGITAGFLSQLKEPFQSACNAAYINGFIGDMLYKEKGYGFIASEMLDKIPKAIALMK